jgi:hypothetical protein
MRGAVRRGRASWGVAAGVCGVALAASCADDLPREQSPALHAVHSSTIRARMARLEHLTVDELAGVLADPAPRLPDLIANVDMESEDRSHFIVFADALRGRSLRLAEAAPTEPPDALAARLHTLTDTCVVCHRAFRVVPPEAGSD